MKTIQSPTYYRKNLRTSSINRDNNNDDDDNNVPRQILLPIGGGIVGKLAASATNLSYRKLLDDIFPNFNSEILDDTLAQPSPKHRNPSASGINDESVCYLRFYSIFNNYFPIFLSFDVHNKG